MTKPRTLFEKIWRSHGIRPRARDLPTLLYIDLHLIHEVTSPQAFTTLAQRGLRVRRPERTLATMDHATPTLPGQPHPYVSPQARAQVETLRDNCRTHGIKLHDWHSPQRGIVHVMAPEMGASQPGYTIVCGDSHTSTHGAFGALAFGIGSSEVAQVLATQCLPQRPAQVLNIRIDGQLGSGVGAKDLVLHLIGAIGVAGGAGKVIEYSGSAIRSLNMEGRMTVCNMTIEAGARAGMISPDETTLCYLSGRPLAPRGAAFDAAAKRWLALASDRDAVFDAEFSLDARKVKPTLSYGTDPGMVVAIDEPVPEPDGPDQRHALDYMALQAGRPLLGHHIDVVFIGSCTNGRLGDLREAADILAGRRVASGVRALVVPGSEPVRKAAEAEGLDRIFLNAGAEWRLPGCSMCIAMNGDQVGRGQTAVSTSNRNFEGRQGPGARTLLASPGTAAACAIAGCVADPRGLLAAQESG